MNTEPTWDRSPALFRAEVRAGRFSGPTAGRCPGYVQANVVVVPEAFADEFGEFCRLNSQACPLLDRLLPGATRPSIAADADMRTDVPRYRVFRYGVADVIERQSVVDRWRDDLVTFLLGCSFTFETALTAAGLPVRHIDEGRNVSMYLTSRACATAGRFAGPLVVSMRPYRPEQIDRVVAITGSFPAMHGAPVHIGDPAALGIRDLARPDFGDPVTIRDGEVPLFWACGVTPQLALAAAQPEIAITHSPGRMLITDLADAQFQIPSS
ncbi:MAG: putative hydro-lyase [Planctomycetia bacterium]|nr:putative hydro-lyase [Planctomycetia bacterium]